MEDDDDDEGYDCETVKGWTLRLLLLELPPPPPTVNDSILYT